MADKTYYAWSNIHHHLKDGDTTKKVIIRPGTVVTQDKLGYNDDDWAELLEGGAVRSMKWPDDLDPKNPNALSPNEHRLRKLRLQREALEAEMAGVGGTPGDTNPSPTDDNVEVRSDGTAAPVKDGS